MKKAKTKTQTNYSITYAGAQDDARDENWRPPVASMYGAYCRGWMSVRSLPGHVTDWGPDW